MVTMRAKTRGLAVNIRATLSASLEERVKGAVICTVMNECPYCLLWQGLLSCELQAMPAASILQLDSIGLTIKILLDRHYSSRPVPAFWWI